MIKSVSGLSYDELETRLKDGLVIANQSELARLLGLGKAAVSWSKRRGTVPWTWLHRLEGLGLRRSWLIRGEGTMRDMGSTPVLGLGILSIPVMASKLDSAGDIVPVEPADVVGCSVSWARSRGNEGDLIGMRISGNEMSPEVKDGNTVIIDTSKLTPDPGRIYAFKMYGHIVIRQVTLGSTGIRLVSLSGAGGDIEVGDTGALDFVGKVIWSCRDHT